MVLDPGRFEDFDPFLFLAEDFFGSGTFDLHPHRGQETVTFVIDGILEHYDNNAGEGQLGPGDVQWMTAGRGVIHREDPAEGQTVHSLQLWINLPSGKKMSEPRYQNLRSEDMPVRREEGALLRVFSGSSGDVVSETQNHVPITMVEMLLEPGATVSQDLPGSYNGFIYVLEGSGTFGSDQVEAKKNQGMLLEAAADPSQPSELRIQANNKLRLLLYAGEPIGEKVVQYGPFVMNTEDEIRQAFADYQSGQFVSVN